MARLEQFRDTGTGFGPGMKFGGMYGQIEQSIYLNSSADQTGKKTLNIGGSRSARKSQYTDGRAKFQNESMQSLDLSRVDSLRVDKYGNSTISTKRLQT